MKKTLLTLLSLLVFQAGFSQYYYVPYVKEGKNPGGLNTEGENPASLLTGWSSIWSGNGTASVAYSANQTIPFAFSFNGNAASSYKVSNAGIVTFDVASSTAPSAFGNLTLPNANVPNNSVCVLGIAPSSWGTYQSSIITKTFGTAPNRQHWIQFNFFSEANIQKGWTYWSVVLEETTNKIYIVDMKTLCVDASNYICTGNVKLSAGIQVDNSTAFSIAGSPNLAAGNNSTNLFDASDNSFYEFRTGTQPTNDLASIKVNTADYLAMTQLPFVITGEVMNQGSDPITSYEIYYTINNGTPEKATITGVNIPMYGRATFSHSVTWSPSANGTYTIKIYPGLVNTAADGYAGNDNASKDVQVVTDFVVRKPLHEVFTSSTCAPCTAGNANTDNNIFPNRDGKLTVVKYQMSWPSTGDPYFTAEGNVRRTLYGVNSIPNMQVDGGWNGNAQSYTLALFDQFAAKPSFIDITATHTINWKTLKLDVKIKPLTDFTNSNLRLFVSVNEKMTTKNVKTNGETMFHHVMKKMLPDANGTVIGNLTTNNEKTFPTFTWVKPGAYRLPLDGQSANIINVNTENSIEEMEDLEVVVWVQDIATKEVFQSAYSTGTLLGIDPIKAEETGNFVVYPNPSASGVTNIKFNLNNDHSLKVNVYNSMGQLIETVANQDFTSGKNNLQFNTANYAKGIYTVKIEGGNFVSAQTFIVQ